MAKNAYWFSHDHNARNDEKILELRAEYGHAGYGIFWMFIESMAESTDGYLNRGAMGGLSISFGIPKNQLNDIVDFCINTGLFISAGEKFSNGRVLIHKQELDHLRESGKKGAKKRWQNSPPIAPPNGDPNAKERRGKEITGKEIGEIPPKPESNDTIEIPTLEAVKERFKNAGEPDDTEAVKFFNHYESMGWRKNGQPIFKWVSLVKSWQDKARQFRQSRNDNPSGPPPPPTTKTYNR